MKKIALALLLLASYAVTACPQEQPPQLLIKAAHCLAVKHIFPRSKATELTFEYLVDEKSYPGKKIMYVVTYAGPARSNGSVFTIVLSAEGESQVFDIQNNASFILSNDDFHGVTFVNPPLGGDWTQERIASAVKRIEKQPRFTIPIKDFSVADASVRCESYTDPQPKPASK